MYVPGRPASGPTDHNVSLINRVNPRFFETVGQPVIRGRGFTQRDTANSPFVTVVNQAFVERFFPNEDPIGQHFGDFGQGAAGSFEVVGIVENAKYTNPREQARPMYFRPLSHWQLNLTNTTAATAETASHYINSIILRFDGEPRDLEASVRQALDNFDPNLTIVSLHSLNDQLNGNFNQEVDRKPALPDEIL